jgi:CheY-like chemotaxis protein
VELPIMESSQPQIGAPLLEIQAGQLQLTVLLVEPEPVVQKQLVDLLTKRGHRVVPVTSAEEAADLAHRMRFEVSFCSTRLPGLTWVDYYERVRHHVGSFVLLTDGYDGEIAKAFQGGEGFVLSKPLDAAHLNRVLSVIEERFTRLGEDVP